MNKSTQHLALNAIVSALYVVLTLPFGSIANNNFIQVRPAEALTVLPALIPSVSVGLAVGCAISNILSAFGLVDIALGSVVTLVAGLLTAKVCKKSYLAPIPPTVLNAVFLPLVWLLSAVVDNPNSTITASVYFTQMASLLLSQAFVCFGLGIPLYYVTKNKILPRLNILIQ